MNGLSSPLGKKRNLTRCKKKGNCFTAEKKTSIVKCKRESIVWGIEKKVFRKLNIYFAGEEDLDSARVLNEKNSPGA